MATLAERTLRNTRGHTLEETQILSEATRFLAGYLAPVPQRRGRHVLRHDLSSDPDFRALAAPLISDMSPALHYSENHLADKTSGVGEKGYILGFGRQRARRPDPAGLRRPDLAALRPLGHDLGPGARRNRRRLRRVFRRLVRRGRDAHRGDRAWRCRFCRC